METHGIPVYGAEASLTGKFITEGNTNWVHVKANENNICFQKEALLNIAESIVPEQYTKIAWVDHDLLFTNLNWYDEASKALDELNLIQLFEHCYWTDNKGNIERHAQAVLSIPNLTNEHINIRNGEYNAYHCGFALAANRSLWSSGIKLYPYCFIGGGDVSLIFNVISDDTSTIKVKHANHHAAQSFKPFLEYTPTFYKYVNKKTGCISGSVFHEYHGPRLFRKHGARQKLIDKFNFNLNTSLVLNNGLLEVHDNQFVNVLKQYFEERREDD